jgi:hypothetical protein
VGLFGSRDRPRDLLQDRTLEQQAERQLDAESGTHPGQEAHGGEGVPAEIEEVVAEPHELAA